MCILKTRIWKTRFLGRATLTDLMTIFMGVKHIQMSWNVAHILATLSTLRISIKFHWCVKMCWCQHKTVKKRHFLPILTPENSSQTNIVTTNLVKTMFLNYCNGVLSEKKTVELKFITSVPPYRLNNLETRISGFAENSILAALEHLLERNSLGNLPQFRSCYV